jgi:16S rRNA (uracil1498-N3)-methyltransferase
VRWDRPRAIATLASVGVSEASPERRRFFLAEPPEGRSARLAAEELHHLLHVLRAAPGDEFLGLDGAGRAWPLRVLAVRKREVELAVTGDAVREGAAGSADAPLAWLELAIALPRTGRAEELIDRATQLGIAAWTPLVCERSQGGARELSAARLSRLERAAAEACKQSRRLWLPVRREPSSPEQLAESARAGARLALLSPAAPSSLLDLALAWRDRGDWPDAARPLVVAVGPEGGFTESEERALCDAGASSASLGPHILRVETAAEAALAVLSQVFVRRPAAHARAELR